jgi:hypothetical protein
MRCRQNVLASVHKDLNCILVWSPMDKGRSRRDGRQLSGHAQAQARGRVPSRLEAKGMGSMEEELRPFKQRGGEGGVVVGEEGQ